MTHQSYNSNNGVSDLFAVMFPDSQIAKDFSARRMKLRYMIVFGFAPYFLGELERQINSCEHFVVLFDESYNQKLNKGQMDIMIRFFDEQDGKMCTRYLKSEFLDKAATDDIRLHLGSSIARFDLSKLVQISMDGPNVNLKLYRDFVMERESDFPSAPLLLDVGACSLHVIHGSFRTGVQKTGWKIGDLLKSLGYLFSDSPVRRKNFMDITQCSKFDIMLDNMQIRTLV